MTLSWRKSSRSTAVNDEACVEIALVMNEKTTVRGKSWR